MILSFYFVQASEPSSHFYKKSYTEWMILKPNILKNFLNIFMYDLWIKVIFLTTV